MGGYKQLYFVYLRDRSYHLLTSKSKSLHDYFIIPVNIYKIQEVDFPFVFFQNDFITILLEEFTIAEREKYLRVEGLEVNNNSISINSKYKEVYNSEPEALTASYKFKLLFKQTISQEELTMIFDSLCFISLLKFSSYLKLKMGVRNECASFKMGHSYKFKTDDNETHSLKDIQDASLYFISIINCNKILEKRKSVYLKLFQIIKQEYVDLGLACSLYITMLESIFTTENTEITYRLALRTSKYLNGDYELFKKIKSLYANRSTFYHIGENKFTEEHRKYLDKTVRMLILDLFIDAEKFKTSTLDESLLN